MQLLGTFFGQARKRDDSIINIQSITHKNSSKKLPKGHQSQPLFFQIGRPADKFEDFLTTHIFHSSLFDVYFGYNATRPMFA
jgi:hypothetical protein